jgi:hypothetical protein
MFQSSSITNLNDLQTWFNSLDKHGYWVVYRGPEKKPGERAASGSYESVETGWLALSQSISIQTQGGGLFTVYVSKNEKDTSGYTTRFASSIGISGLPMMQGGIGSPDSIGALVAAQVSEKMEAYKKDRMIEDLETEIQELKKGKGRKRGISGLLSDFGELLEENQNLANIVTPIIHGIAARFLGNMDSGRMPSVAGIHHQAGKDPDSPDEEFSEEEVQRLVNCVNRFSEHFEDPISLLERFANFVDENPENAKFMLQSILSNK